MLLCCRFDVRDVRRRTSPRKTVGLCLSASTRRVLLIIQRQRGRRSSPIRWRGATLPKSTVSRQLVQGICNKSQKDVARGCWPARVPDMSPAAVGCAWCGNRALSVPCSSPWLVGSADLRADQKTIGRMRGRQGRCGRLTEREPACRRRVKTCSDPQPLRLAKAATGENLAD